ncbi:MAG: hypothetical protein JWM10_266 [Myxococcaceae bacterium]|nr:hypothetical protein [Myxococcaceae bacterium]
MMATRCAKRSSCFGDAHIDLLTEPATGLRRAEVRGTDAARWRAEVAAAVPVATPAYARDLLRADDPVDAGMLLCTVVMSASNVPLIDTSGSGLCVALICVHFGRLEPFWRRASWLGPTRAEA